MDKFNVLYELKEKLDGVLSRDDYVIVYGAAMVILKAKPETHDVDITLTEAGYKKLLEKGYTFEDYDNGKKVSKKCKISDEIDAFYGGFMTPIVAKEKDGFWVQTLESLIAEKSVRGREKDLEDVKAILLRHPLLVIDVNE